MVITNWFSVAAGICFFAAALYELYSGHEIKLVALYGLLFGVNVILGTL